MTKIYYVALIIVEFLLYTNMEMSNMFISSFMDILKVAGYLGIMVIVYVVIKKMVIYTQKIA